MTIGTSMCGLPGFRSVAEVRRDQWLVEDRRARQLRGPDRLRRRRGRWSGDHAGGAGFPRTLRRPVRGPQTDRWRQWRRPRHGWPSTVQPPRRVGAPGAPGGQPARHQPVTLAFRCARDESGDVHKLDDSRHNLLRFDDFRYFSQTRIGHFDHARVGLDGAERIILCGDTRLRRFAHLNIMAGQI